MNTPSRQLPSVMTFGVSAIAATLRPLMSVPSTSPLVMLKTRVTRQRSYVAPCASDALHGHMNSHEQVSKYVPSRFQAMPPPWEERVGGALPDSLSSGALWSTKIPVTLGPTER